MRSLKIIKNEQIIIHVIKFEQFREFERFQ
jgi:hypothetical protein